MKWHMWISNWILNDILATRGHRLEGYGMLSTQKTAPNVSCSIYLFFIYSSSSLAYRRYHNASQSFTYRSIIRIFNLCRSIWRIMPGGKNIVQVDFWSSLLYFNPHRCWLSTWWSYKFGTTLFSIFLSILAILLFYNEKLVFTSLLPLIIAPYVSYTWVLTLHLNSQWSIALSYSLNCMYK